MQRCALSVFHFRVKIHPYQQMLANVSANDIYAVVSQSPANHSTADDGWNASCIVGDFAWYYIGLPFIQGDVVRWLFMHYAMIISQSSIYLEL